MYDVSEAITGNLLHPCPSGSRHDDVNLASDTLTARPLELSHLGATPIPSEIGGPLHSKQFSEIKITIYIYIYSI